MLINQICSNPKVVVDGGELARNMWQKKNLLQACRSPLYDNCYRREYLFNKQLEYCQSVR